ncbi:MAG: sulfite oxidase [Candidatus Marinimicrobia bacterium]|nr:sulfite oxidase [Candidatus Neomarinimicrobiota bacterium]
MALFVVKHEHSADVCPAQDPRTAPMLLAQLSAENAAKYDVTIHGEAVVDGGHTLYLILNAPDIKQVEGFMSMFAQVGSVEVLPSNSCEFVVARLGC